MSIALLFAGLLAFAPVQAQNPRAAAPQFTQGLIDLRPDFPGSIEQGVAEWDSDILKLSRLAGSISPGDRDVFASSLETGVRFLISRILAAGR